MLPVNPVKVVVQIMKALASSFEKSKAKKAMKMRHGSATSKAAAAGRKQQMHMRKARAFTGTPQSEYLKEKAAPAKQPPKKKQSKQNKTHQPPVMRTHLVVALKQMKA